MSDHNPFDTPKMSAEPPRPTGSNREHLIKVARAQRHVLFVVLAYLCLIPVNVVAGQFEPLQIVGPIFGLGVMLAGAVTVFHLVSLFRGKVAAVFYVIGLLIPCLGLILLLVISSEATNILKANGIKVGLLGADPDSI